MRREKKTDTEILRDLSEQGISQLTKQRQKKKERSDKI